MLMTPENITILAEGIARGAHAGQTRRDGITPYIAHPARVVAILREQDPKHAETYTLAVAWLHDVLEDTSVTPDHLRSAGIPASVVYACERMCRRREEGYKAYLARVKEDPATRDVKIADMLANLGDSPTGEQIRKYAEGLLFLTE